MAGIKAWVLLVVMVIMAVSIVEVEGRNRVRSAAVKHPKVAVVKKPIVAKKKHAGPSPSGSACSGCRTSILNCCLPYKNFTVTDGDSLYTASTYNPGGYIFLDNPDIVMTRGLYINTDINIVCAFSSGCILDISQIPNVGAIVCHGGGHVTVSGVTFAGGGVNRTAPVLDFTGQNTTTALSNIGVTNVTITTPGVSAITADGTASATFVGTTNISDVTVANNTAVIQTTENSSDGNPGITVCSIAGNATVGQDGAANNQICTTTQNSNTTITYVNGTATSVTVVTNSTSCASSTGTSCNATSLS